MQLRIEQRLVRVNVSNTCRGPLVQQKGLHRRAPSLKPIREEGRAEFVVRGKVIVQRFRSQVSKKISRVGKKPGRAEDPRVHEP